MAQFLLSVWSTHGEPVPSDDVIQQMYADVDVVNDALKAAGAMVFGGGLQPFDTAAVVLSEDGKVVITDGPFVGKAKVQLGGFWIIDVADRDAALAWAAKATVACRAPVEVRPFQDE